MEKPHTFYFQCLNRGSRETHGLSGEDRLRGAGAQGSLSEGEDAWDESQMMWRNWLGVTGRTMPTTKLRSSPSSIGIQQRLLAVALCLASESQMDFLY